MVAAQWLGVNSKRIQIVTLVKRQGCMAPSLNELYKDLMGKYVAHCE